MRRTSFSTITHTLDTATSITILHFKKKSKKKHETKRIKFEIVARNIGRLPNVQAHTHTSIEWRIQQILNFATQTHDYFVRLCNNKRRGKAKRNILCYYIAQHRIDHIPFLVENKILIATISVRLSLLFSEYLFSSYLFDHFQWALINFNFFYIIKNNRSHYIYKQDNASSPTTYNLFAIRTLFHSNTM